MNNELIAKAAEAKSAEELLALAKENGIEMTEDNAKEIYERMNASGELSDDELDSVSGGGCKKATDKRKLVYFTDCPICHAQMEITPYIVASFDRDYDGLYGTPCPNCGRSWGLRIINGLIYNKNLIYDPREG